MPRSAGSQSPTSPQIAQQRALSAAAEQGLMSAPLTAAAMRDHLHAGEIGWVWRMLLQGRDHLALMLCRGDETLLDSWKADPETTGSTEWDALLAALTAHEFETSERAAPAWTITEPLPEPWILHHPFLAPDRVEAQTPDWLRRRNIFVPARDLVTA